MRRFLADLAAALRDLVHPQPWPEPDEDVVTPAAMRQWVAGHKHPDQCNRGCQCGTGGDAS